MIYNNDKIVKATKFKDGEKIVTKSEEDFEDSPKEYKLFGIFAEGGRVKGINNNTGESYGVVIGSVKKSDEDIDGGTEMNVRSSYSSRISEVKLVFDKNGNLHEITDYGYGLEGNFPDTSKRSGGRIYNADKKETLEILSKKYNPAFAKKLIELAKSQGLHTMIGVIDSENKSSITFHEQFGFKTVGIIKESGYKFDRWLDSVFMQLLLE